MQDNLAKQITNFPTPKQKSIIKLDKVFSLVARKRSKELIRFRTCCADPRASK